MRHRRGVRAGTASCQSAPPPRFHEQLARVYGMYVKPESE